MNSNYVVIGAGGIGYYLIESLVRFLEYQAKRPVTVTIVDGDKIEEKNLARQHTLADLGRNKAQVIIEQIARKLAPKNVTLKALPLYFTNTTKNESQFKDLFADGTVAFLCVDNNATRYLAEQIVSKAYNSVLVMGGNDFEQGQAQLYVRKNGKDLSPKITDFSPDIKDLDQFPDEVGCDVAVVSEPQLLLVNQAVANAMLSLWYSQIEKQLNASNNIVSVSLNEVIVDVGKASAHQFLRTSLVKT